MMKNRGFTIVELLIVIVVIAILAAITIVAYNGIQNRAKASAAQAAARQAFTKIQTFAVSNADTYPADLSAAGLSSSSDTSYQYRVDNTASPRTFCVTATTQNVSYYVSNAGNSPTAGACAGHGANGVAAITNLITNPSFEGSVSGWSPIGGVGLGSASWSQSGASSISVSSSTTGSDTAASTSISSLETNTTYTASAYGRVVTPASGTGPGGNGALQLVVFVNNGTSWAIHKGNQIANTAGSTGRSVVTFTTGATVSQVFVRLYLGYAAGSMNWDAVMLTQGVDVPTFSDGSSPGWIWNGTPNNSTSTGPPL
jgi:prepilin-type N-terminal cleavage/methylation domain-containing protein